MCQHDEMVDMADSKSAARKGVGVQVPLLVPLLKIDTLLNTASAFGASFFLVDFAA